MCTLKLKIHFSITGIKKRNRRTGTVFTFNERLKKWEQQVDQSDDFNGTIQTITKNITNLGSISTNSKRPRQIIACGNVFITIASNYIFNGSIWHVTFLNNRTTSISETGFESNLKTYIHFEFSSSNYNLESMNCNTFSRFIIQVNFSNITIYLPCFHSVSRSNRQKWSSWGPGKGYSWNCWDIFKYRKRFYITYESNLSRVTRNIIAIFTRCEIVL